MKRTIEVIYDGEVLRPQEPLDLEPNGRYRVTIEESFPDTSAEGPPQLLKSILACARDLGVPDLAEEHDHYLYCSPKRKRD